MFRGVGGGGGIRHAAPMLPPSRLWLITVLALSTCHPAAACQPEPRATVALDEAGGVPLVPVTINGNTAHFVLDTGAERSVIGLAAADRVHLARDEWVSTDTQGLGGRDRRRLGRPASLSVAGIALRRHTLAADNSLVVGPLPDRAGNQPIDGLLGQDYLSAFDLDLDLPSHQLILYSVAGCSGRFLPWTVPYDAVAAWRPVRNILAVPLHVGRTTLEAILDSGASVSMITLPGMVALGLSPGGPALFHGFGPRELPGRIERFDWVQVGDLPAAPAALAVAPVETMRSLGALLGADWLAQHHVWISWSTDQLLVARPG